MSWKSLITAGLLCVLASPVFAASAVPQLEIINDGLDASGNWVWYVRVAPSDGARTNPTTPTGSPMAVELGFNLSAGGTIKSVTNVGYTQPTASGPANLWDTDTPGKMIFGWEDFYQIADPNTGNLTGTLAPEGMEIYCGTCTGGNAVTLTNGATRPTGTSNVGSGSVPNNHPTTLDGTAGDHANTTTAPPVNTQLFVALGSDVLSGTNTSTTYSNANASVLGVSNATAIGQGNQVLKIITAGPKLGQLTSTLQLLGSHGTPGFTEGRIAEITSGTNGSNYRGFGGPTSVTVNAGDANLDKNVDLTDLVTLQASYGAVSGKNWSTADFNGDGAVDLTDLVALQSQYGATGIGSYTPLAVSGTVDTGAGAPLGGTGLESASVPEPASIALVGLGLLGGMGLIRRKR